MNVYMKPNGLYSACILIAIWVVVICSIWLSLAWHNIAVYVASVFIIGTCQRYLEELSHQAMHKNLFVHPQLNSLMDIFYSVPLFYTIKIESEEHYNHHKYLAAEQAKKNYSYDHLGISNKWIDDKWYRRFILYVQPFLGVQALIEFKNILTNIKTYYLNCYLYHVLAITILIYFQLGYVYLYYWLIPYFTVYCIFYYYSELFTHFGCRGQYLSRDTVNWFADLFIAPLGFCKYHSLHHIYPKIPWFNYSRIDHDYLKNRQSLNDTFKSMLISK